MTRFFKKQLTIIMAIIMMISCFMISSSADSSLTFTISEGSCKAGEKVTIPVILSGNSGITGWNIWISYNDSVMKLVSVKAQECDFKDSGDFDIGEDLTANPFSIMCDGKKTFKTEGTMAELTFDVDKDAAAGEYAVEFYTDMTMATIDDDGTPYSNLVLKNGTITVEGNPAPIPDTDSDTDSDSDTNSKIDSDTDNKIDTDKKKDTDNKKDTDTDKKKDTDTNKDSGKTSSTSSVTSPKTGEETPFIGTLLVFAVSCAAIMGFGKRKEND